MRKRLDCRPTFFFPFDQKIRGRAVYGCLSDFTVVGEVEVEAGNEPLGDGVYGLENV